MAASCCPVLLGFMLACQFSSADYQLLALTLRVGGLQSSFSEFALACGRWKMCGGLISDMHGDFRVCFCACMQFSFLC